MMKKASCRLNTTAISKAISYFLFACLSGCSTYPTWIPSDGPNKTEIQNAVDDTSANQLGIQLVDVDDGVARKVIANLKHSSFSDMWGDNQVQDFIVKPGDVIAVSIWEAPPAMLFASGGMPGSGTSGMTSFPLQMVNLDGVISIPFAGHIHVSGKTPFQIEKEIATKLQGLANTPQVLVQIATNNTTVVSVIGDFNANIRMPLTPRGERLMDALAAAGGTKDPVNKETLQVTRGTKVQSMPLAAIIDDPEQNILLQPGDVITSLYQSNSLTVFGATGNNSELAFEAQGITLAQALARSNGVNDLRADARGVFIFRFEAPDAVNLDGKDLKLTPEGRVPVIYRINLKDPQTFFVAQSFPMKNHDLLFVSNAPGADLQKFLSIVVSAVYPVAQVLNTINPYKSNL